jgi:hypothetical protein
MPKKPVLTNYGTGQDTYLTIFDTVNSKTRAVTEFNKVALSELGYIYIKRDPTFAETLVVEGRQSRNFLSELARIPQNGNFLLAQDGSYLLAENGGRIMLNSTQDTMFDQNMQSINVNYGEGLANSIKVVVYPRQVDTSPVVLFSLNTPISLAPLETKTGIKGTYRDPASKASKVTAKTIVVPVAATDWNFTTNSDGTGSNINGYLQITAIYGAEGASFTFKNNHPTLSGYISYLQVRGYGTYLYDSISQTLEDATSISQNGLSEVSLDMKYQTSLDNAAAIGNVILQQDKDARTYLNSVNFLANAGEDDKLLMSFLWLDLGDMIYIREPKTAIDGNFFIQAVKFTVKPGGIIYFTWKVVEALSLEQNYWILDTSTLGITTKLGY